MRDDDLDKSPEKSTSWQGFKFFCPDSGNAGINPEQNIEAFINNLDQWNQASPRVSDAFPKRYADALKRGLELEFRLVPGAKLFSHTFTTYIFFEQSNPLFPTTTTGLFIFYLQYSFILYNLRDFGDRQNYRI